ncbi:hypothetical protein HYH02_008582 [Chlamydomonas schloesseri]|uniref:DSBA-like thioredoxin domain-containing protein n=1 Tax=Chlamydomonas schloesseri TaxID=2026947 RepID=A0A835WFQ5_9CHLO|nr:hypothetical protein HYH02_008582 [Chlamydomonas schloesseri]|eukprot:KAG2446597.1 hypothetical protein HYH02_008582 [Chlamydomonas schloesseri]
MAKKAINVEVISDTVCPWCFVGKRRLEQAMAKFADRADFKVTWRPYQLAPEAPKEGMNKMQYYNDKFGPAKVAQMMPMMAKVYADLGLAYSTGGMIGNTLDSHRLIAWAEQFGHVAQNKLVEEFFLDYFTREKFIGGRDVLLDGVGRAGLDVAAAAAVLDDPTAYRQQVEQQIARARGVGGVPFFTVEGRYKMSGAQPPELFEELFEQICSK